MAESCLQSEKGLSDHTKKTSCPHSCPRLRYPTLPGEMPHRAETGSHAGKELEEGAEQRRKRRVVFKEEQDMVDIPKDARTPRNQTN